MPVFSGRMLLRQDAPEAWVRLEGARVVEWGKGEPPEKPAAEGWIVPGPVNAHTHVADAFLHDRPGKPRDVAQLVGPEGWKHRHLAEADPEEQSAATQAHVAGMADVGTSAFIDFREGGIEGARWLRGLELAVRPVVHGRPLRPGFDEVEATRLLHQVDGIGLSGMRDMPGKLLEEWAEACHEAHKPFAVHVSEARRDDIDAVLSLEPAYVVHMTQGTQRDFEELADARVPIVACPRSNAWFGMHAPLSDMLEAGCTVALGTDNAMLQDGDVLQEARAARASGVSVEDALRMATHHGRDLAGLPDALPPTRGAAADLVVLPWDVLDGAATKPRIEPYQERGNAARRGGST